MPDFYSNFKTDKERAQFEAKIAQEQKAKRDFARFIDDWHNAILNPNDNYAKLARQYLLDRGFSLDTIKALKIGLRIEPFGAIKEPRIIFPYWNETGSTVIYFTSRKFPAFLKDGVYVEEEKTPKYKKASLEKYPFLHNAPMGLNTLNRKGKDGNGVLVITEGVCDWLAFYQEGYSVLSPNGGGDEKFWSTIIKKVNEFKYILLAFDNDDAGKEFTYKAAQILMKEDIPFKCADFLMTKDIAEYYQVAGNLNAVVNSVRDGLDWLIDSLRRPENYEDLPLKVQKDLKAKCKEILTHIALSGKRSLLTDAMLSVRKYFPKDFASDIRSEIEDQLKEGMKIKRKNDKKNEQMRIINLILREHRLIHDPRVGFYEYNEKYGRWEHKNDETIGGYAMNVLGEYATWPVVSHIVNLLKRDDTLNNDFPVSKFNTLPLLSFINGTLHIDVLTGEVALKPHHFTDYNTVTLPFVYDPKAKAPRWQRFIEDITAGDKESQITLQEFPGYVLLPHCGYQKCLLLKGYGANGKSVYADVIGEVFGGIGRDGRGYVSHVEPAKFREQFRLMPFMHSLMNVSSDTETDIKGAEGIFKRIIAGEVLEDSYKFRDNVQFSTRTKLFMCCNNFPITGDTTEGFMRRFLIVELPRHYVDNPIPHTNQRKIDYQLKSKLLQELPGIFNWIVQGMQRLVRQNGFTKTLKEEKILREFRCVNNHVFAFVEENMNIFFNEDRTGKRINKRDIFKTYITWCEGEYIQPISAHRFYSNLRGVLNSYGITFTEKGLIWTFDDDPNKEKERQEILQELAEEAAENEDYNDDNNETSEYLQDPEEELDYEHDNDDDDDGGENLMYAK